MMSLRASLFSLSLVASLGVATAALATPFDAADKIREIRVQKVDGEREVDLRADDQQYKFKLPELKDGEQRKVGTADGKVVDVLRKGDTYHIKAGDADFELPAAGAEWTTRFHRPALHGVSEGILIAGAKLSEAEQQKVRDALKAAGIDKQVNFAQPHVNKEVHVMKLDENCELANHDKLGGHDKPTGKVHVLSSSGKEPKVIINKQEIITGEKDGKVAVFVSSGDNTGDAGSIAEAKTKLKVICEQRKAEAAGSRDSSK